MNQLTIIGNLSKKPDIKYSQEGNAYAKFRVIVKRPRTKKDEVDGFNCTAFGKQAENIANFLDKGSKVAVIGHVTFSKSESGQYFTDVLVHECEFLSPSNGNTSGGGQTSNRGQSRQSQGQNNQEYEYQDVSDEDLPF